MGKVIPQPQWEPYIRAAMLQHATLQSMGLVRIEDGVNASGGKYFSKPIEDSLDSISNPQQYDATTTITPTTLSDYQEDVVLAHYGDGVYGNDYNRLVRGTSDTIDQARTQLAQNNENVLESYLVSATKGIFDTALATSHEYDKSTEGDGYFTMGGIYDLKQGIWGENMNRANTIVAPSIIYRDMLENGLTSTSQRMLDAAIFEGKILQLGDMQVMINDTLCESTTNDAGDTVYPVYVMAGQPYYLGFQSRLRAETDRDPAVGGGKDFLYWYADFAPHIEFLDWNTSVVDPEKSDLETGANWSKVGITNVNKKIGIGRMLIKARA